MYAIAVRCIAGLALVAATHPAIAAVPRTGSYMAADTLTALPSANVHKPLRAVARVVWNQAAPPQAWHRLAATGAWQAAWDAATGVPRRIWGEGIAAPGTVASAAAAERFARNTLTAHIELLAPGSVAADFTLVSNAFDGEIRAVGFRQTARGHAVVGGQVSFLFKRDRLIVIGSEALPNVAIVAPMSSLARTAARTQAVAALRSAVSLFDAPVTPEGEDVVLPLISDDAVLGYRLVTPLTIDGGANGRYTGYVDATSGQIVAIRQRNLYATGTVRYRSVDRYPGRGRLDVAAARAHILVNGVATPTSQVGAVNWSPDAQATVQTSVDGDLTTIVNKAGDGRPASAQYPLDPGGQMVWDASGIIDDDAQVIAYVNINLAKEYVRAHLDSHMATLDEQLVVNVNIDQGCNAFFDGTAVNFFRSTARCENTARIQDVVFHEFGHRLHTAEIVSGVGGFDSAMSEGAADFFAATITGDSGMGRGFDFTNAPLRQLDPPDSEWMWPTDIGEIHHTGLIFAGVFWDLRKSFIASLGDEAGSELVNKLYIGALRYAVDIPSTLVAVLATDDDDGNLANGTPHECAIGAAFANHGLRAASGSVIAPGRLGNDARSTDIAVEIVGVAARCPSDQLVSVTLPWQANASGTVTSGTAEALSTDPDHFSAQLPLSPDQTLQFNVVAKFQIGSPLTLADNLADPDYELYVGRAKPLYCTDFEHEDPLTAGWTTATADGATSPWQWGIPTSGATDPHSAYSGDYILSLGLNQDYAPKQRSWVQMPEIDVGAYSDVRLQYRRYLAVEDGFYDQARITVNGAVAWQNRATANANASSINHVDREWRFHDVPVSSFLFDHKLRIGWSLTSDEGLNLGGWALDDVCIIANPASICGDGVKSPTEQCDTGLANADAPDACRTYCKLPSCGDGIVDTGEACDAGSAGSSGCSADCKAVVPAAAGGCSTTADDNRFWYLLGFATLAMRQRRQSRHQGR